MNLQKHAPVILYLGATAATFGITGILKFLAGAFGLADSTEFLLGLGFLACVIWIYASRIITAIITPRCPVCGGKPCGYPRCPQCGRNLEPHHAAAAGEQPCACQHAPPAKPAS
jgi:hypothetical protein